MSKNCLVQKLKGVADNSTLPKYGVMWMRVLSNGSLTEDNRYTTITATADGPVIIKVLGGGFISISSTGAHLTELTVAAGTQQAFYVGDIGEEYDIEISKYTTLAVSGGGSGKKRIYCADANYSALRSTLFLAGNLDDLQVMPNLASLSLYNPITGGSIISLLERFKDIPTFVAFLIPDITKLPTFDDTLTTEVLKSTHLITLNVAGRLHGDIKEIGNIEELVNLIITENTYLTGTIESFVARKRGHNCTTGTFSLRWLGSNPNITFNGAPIATIENNTLSWDANTITLNGTVILNDDVDIDD